MDILLDEDAWVLVATATGLFAATVFVVKLRRRQVSTRTKVTSTLNLFLALWIGIMGTGHLFAVTAKSILGTLPPNIHQMDCDSLWFCHCYSRVVALWNRSRSNARGKSSHNNSDIAKWMAGAGLGHTSSASSRIRSSQSGSIDLAEEGDKPPTGCYLTGLQAGNAQSFRPSSRFQSLLRRRNFPP